jgi:hypothetical protein
LVGRTEGKIRLGRPRRWCGDNIKTDLQEGGWGVMDWIDLTQGRIRCRGLVNAVMNLRVPQMRGISWLAEDLLALRKDSAPCSHLVSWLIYSRLAIEDILCL